MNHSLKNVNDMVIMPEVDEQWSFVKSKKWQRWTWYALDKLTGRVVAYAFGKRNDSTLEKLLEILEDFTAKLWFSDDWSSYERLLPAEKHIAGKRFTQKIERRNLNLRTRIKRLARKTICFSKTESIHDKVIGTYIERYEF